MRPLYVLIFVAAVFLSSIDASTATTATSINSRRLVSAEQDKTDGKQFLRAEVKDEDSVDDEERVSLPSSVSAIAKSAMVATTKVKETARAVQKQLAVKMSQGTSDRYFKWYGLDVSSYNPKGIEGWVETMKVSNKLNPEVNMLKTLTQSKNLDDAGIARWIQHHKEVDTVIGKMQNENFSRMKKMAKKEGVDLKTLLKKSVGDDAYHVDTKILEEYDDFLRASKA